MRVRRRLRRGRAWLRASGAVAVALWRAAVNIARGLVGKRPTKRVHTIPVPPGWTVEQAWRACASIAADTGGVVRLSYRGGPGWANVLVENGRMVGVLSHEPPPPPPPTSLDAERKRRRRRPVWAQ